jgi:transcriptional regulator with XRE-family HTH domain
MQQVELLERARTKLMVKSDYALAKALGIPNNRMSDYLKGKRVLDEYACFKIAEVLEDSPSKVLARILAETSKNEDKRLYFQRFFTIAGLWIILVPASLVYSTSSEAASVAGNIAEHRMVIDLKAHYAKWSRRIRGVLRVLKRNINVPYFTCNWTRKVPC